MLKRKTLALTLLLLFILSSVCMAYQPDPARWGWIYSDDEVGIFYDKTTIRHYTNYYGDYYDMWTMWVYPAQNQHHLRHDMLYKKRTIKLSKRSEKSIIPDSLAEVVYDHFYH